MEEVPLDGQPIKQVDEVNEDSEPPERLTDSEQLAAEGAVPRSDLNESVAVGLGTELALGGAGDGMPNSENECDDVGLVCESVEVDQSGMGLESTKEQCEMEVDECRKEDEVGVEGEKSNADVGPRSEVDETDGKENDQVPAKSEKLDVSVVAKGEIDDDLDAQEEAAKGEKLDTCVAAKGFVGEENEKKVANEGGEVCALESGPANLQTGGESNDKEKVDMLENLRPGEKFQATEGMTTNENNADKLEICVETDGSKEGILEKEEAAVLENYLGSAENVKLLAVNSEDAVLAVRKDEMTPLVAAPDVVTVVGKEDNEMLESLQSYVTSEKEDVHVAARKEPAVVEANFEDLRLNDSLNVSVAEENEDADMVPKEGNNGIENLQAGDKLDITDVETSLLDGEKSEPAASKDEDEVMAENREEEASTGAKESSALGKVSKKVMKGRNNGVSARRRSRKKPGEEVCFICFDGGDLVLCDRRGCPKVYHPSCVNRDDAFFQAKGVWNCGWHLCSICEKDVKYKCYTCTFSLCKGCIKDTVFYGIRGSKGFCETCMKTVLLIEENEWGNNEVKVDFDDKNNWEYLFKDYWLDLKGKLSLTQDELLLAKNPSKRSDIHADKDDSAEEIHDVNNDVQTDSDGSSGDPEAITPKKRKVQKRLPAKDEDSPNALEDSGNLNGNKRKRRNTNKQSKSPLTEGDTPVAASVISAEGKQKKKRLSKSIAKEGDSPSSISVIDDDETSIPGNSSWASKELLEFVMHLRNGDSSVLSQFDTQELLLKYIKEHKLRDPRRKSYIICDSRLENLFGKRRVAHFEMLQLLESHILVGSHVQADDFQGSVVDNEVSRLEFEGNTDSPTKAVKNKKRRINRKGEKRWMQSNINDYAAIDVHNIKFVFLRRNLVEDLLEDTDYFHDKVYGCFVRIRISSSGQNQDMYRLVQVVGTSRADEPYRVGKKTTDVILEIQNLNKTEVIPIDIISNQEFTEDECRRLRQSIKCGLINALTVGDIQEKAVELQALRVNDWLESEIVRLSHLCDRASDMGRRKELRECVEKIQLLKSPEERQRRLEEIPQVHIDSKMDPNHESEEDEDDIDDRKQDNFWRSRGSGFIRQGRDPLSPRDPISPRIPSDSWSGTRNNLSAIRELGRTFSNRGFLNKVEDINPVGSIVSENIPSQGINPDTQSLHKVTADTVIVGQKLQNSHSEVAPEVSSGNVVKTSQVPVPAVSSESGCKIDESQKIWHYKDPSGKVQGPFSMVQLRKWNNQGYFPKGLRIWRSSERFDDAIMLSEFLKVESSRSEDGSGVSQSQVNSLMASDLSLQVPKASRTQGESDKPTVSSAPTQATLRDTEEQAPEQKIPTISFPVTGAMVLENAHSVQTPSTLVKSSGGPDGSDAPEAVHNRLTTLVNDGSSFLHGGSVHAKTEAGNSSSSTLQYSSQSHVSGNPPNEQAIPAARSDLPSSSIDVPASSINPSVVSRNAAPNLPDMLQSVPVQQPACQSEFQAPNNQYPVPTQQPVYGPGVPSFNSSGIPSGPFPPQGFSGMPPYDAWKPPVPANQTMMQPPPANLGWGPMPPVNLNMGWGGPVMNWGPPLQGPVPGNPDSAWMAPGQGQQPVNTNPSWVAPGNTNPAWVPTQYPAPFNPNQGWVAPGNTNPGWAQPGQVPPTGNVNHGWGPPNQCPAPGNANPGWVAPNQGPPGNANPGWVAPIQGPPTGNVNKGQGPPMGNPHSRGGERTRNSSRSRAPYGIGVCNFHMNGRCKKGSSCDFFHPPKE